MNQSIKRWSLFNFCSISPHETSTARSWEDRRGGLSVDRSSGRPLSREPGKKKKKIHPSIHPLNLRSWIPRWLSPMLLELQGQATSGRAPWEGVLTRASPHSRITMIILLWLGDFWFSSIITEALTSFIDFCVRWESAAETNGGCSRPGSRRRRMPTSSQRGSNPPTPPTNRHPREMHASCPLNLFIFLTCLFLLLLLY